MSIGAELGQYILQTHTSKKFWRFSGGFKPPKPHSGYASGWCITTGRVFARQLSLVSPTTLDACVFSKSELEKSAMRCSSVSVSIRMKAVFDQTFSDRARYFERGGAEDVSSFITNGLQGVPKMIPMLFCQNFYNHRHFSATFYTHTCTQQKYTYRPFLVFNFKVYRVW